MAARSPHHLVDNGIQRPFVGHPTFNAFRDQLLGTVFCALEVTVTGTGSLGHGTKGTHATVGFVTSALIKLNFARSFLSTGQHTAQHDRTGTRYDGFCQVAGEANATVGNHRDVGSFQFCGNIGDRRDLGYTNTGHDTGGTDRARANPHFHTIGTGIHQGPGCCRGSNIAADNLYLRIGFLNPANPFNNPFGVTVGSINNDDIDTGINQRRNTLRGFRPGAYGGTDSQLTVGIFTGVGVVLGFLDIFTVIMPTRPNASLTTSTFSIRCL